MTILSSAIVSLHLAAGLLLFADVQPPADDPVLHARLLAELPSAHARELKGRDGIEGSFVQHNVDFGPDQSRKGLDRRFDYWINGPLLKFEIQSIPSDGIRKVVCGNSGYAFEALRANGGSSYRMTSYEDPLSQKNFRSMLDYYELRPRGGLHVLGSAVPLAEMLKSNQFRLLGVQPVSHQGRPMVRIDFHWKADANASGSDKAPWAILDPGMDWLIQEWHTTTKTSDYTETYEFVTLSSGLRFPQRIDRRIVSRGGSLRREVEDVLETPRPFDGSEGDFLLTAYHLPAVTRGADSGARRRRTIGLLAINATLLIGLIGGAAILRKRRQKPSDVNPAP